MMLRAFSIFDNKALTYAPPFYAATNGAAVRILADVANDPNTAIGRHPADYILYCVGHYNDQDGSVTPYSPLEHVVDAIALVRIQPKGDLFSSTEHKVREFSDQLARERAIKTGTIVDSIVKAG